MNDFYKVFQALMRTFVFVFSSFSTFSRCRVLMPGRQVVYFTRKGPATNSPPMASPFDPFRPIKKRRQERQQEQFFICLSCLQHCTTLDSIVSLSCFKKTGADASEKCCFCCSLLFELFEKQGGGSLHNNQINLLFGHRRAGG